jgi:hypothetical protein
MTSRTYWNKQKGQIVLYHSGSPQWDGRSGLVVGCLRGDQDRDNPWVSVMFDLKADGTPMSHTLWECPANRLEIINRRSHSGDNNENNPHIHNK